LIPFHPKQQNLLRNTHYQDPITVTVVGRDVVRQNELVKNGGMDVDALTQGVKMEDGFPP
jgi:hypothetical protein